MPALRYEHGRPGFYMRVLEEGRVGAGDRVERVAVGAGAMSVREVSALLYLPGHTPAGLRRALAIPALPDGWRGSFEALLAQDETGAGGNHGLARPSTPAGRSHVRYSRPRPEDTRGAEDGPAVAFSRSELTVAWDGRYTSLLELAEACDVPADWSCRTGVCHRCESGLVDGAVDYEPAPLDDPAPDQVLLCCARPRGAVTVDL